MLLLTSCDEGGHNQRVLALGPATADGADAARTTVELLPNQATPDYRNSIWPSLECAILQSMSCRKTRICLKSSPNIIFRARHGEKNAKINPSRTAAAKGRGHPQLNKVISRCTYSSRDLRRGEGGSRGGAKGGNSKLHGLVVLGDINQRVCSRDQQANAMGAKREREGGAVHIRHHVDLASRTLVVFVEISTRENACIFLVGCSKRFGRRPENRKVRKCSSYPFLQANLYLLGNAFRINQRRPLIICQPFKLPRNFSKSWTKWKREW